MYSTAQINPTQIEGKGTSIEGYSLQNCNMDEKVILITGASSGIGEGIAKHMAKIGYKKIAILARREERLQEVRQDLLALGATGVLVLKADLTIAEDCDKAIQEIKTTFGRNCPVNCLKG